MGFAEGHVTGVIDDALVAAESASLGKTTGKAARNVGVGIVVAKTGEDIVVGRKVVVHTDVKLRFIEAADRFAYEIESTEWDCWRDWQGIQIHQGRAEGVNQSGGYFGAGDAGNLAAVWIDGGWRASWHCRCTEKGYRPYRGW